MDEQRIAELDNDLVEAAKGIRVLAALAWAEDSDNRFLADWRAGRPSLPEANQRPVDMSESVARLEAIAARCRQDDAIEEFLRATAQSYANAGRLLGAIGTPGFTQHSVQLYGRPDRLYRARGSSAVDAARFFLDLTDDLLGTGQLPSMPCELSSTDLAARLQTEVDGFFGPEVVVVEEDASITAKAIAGARRIRVRGGAWFSKLDHAQLLNHEAFVHCATMLNGRSQVRLQSLALGAPRTTRTQEGIAVLTELLTNTMDIKRLRRVALRVIAVQQALDGADFLDVFRFFLESGQSEEDSVRSTQRVFRGGAVEGGVVFTKDAVYLSGLFEVHTFMRLAIHESRPELIAWLFGGRLTLADSMRLAPHFQSGWLEPPRYLPEWAADLNRISAFMAYSAFSTNIRLEHYSLDRFFEYERELETLV